MGCNEPRGLKPPGPKLKNMMSSMGPNSKQDGVEGPKLKKKMASMGPNSKQDGDVVEMQDGVVCKDDIKEVVCWVSLSGSRYFVRV